MALQDAKLRLTLLSLKSWQIYFLPGLNMYWIDKKLKMKKKIWKAGLHDRRVSNINDDRYSQTIEGSYYEDQLLLVIKSIICVPFYWFLSEGISKEQKHVVVYSSYDFNRESFYSSNRRKQIYCISSRFIWCKN